MPDARKFDNPFWSYDGQPGQPVDPRRFTRMVDGNQPDLVPDEKPSPNMETRILRDAARQRISEIIGPYFMDATAMVDGDLVRNQDERPIRFKIWAPHRKIAIERLPKGVAANDPAVLRRAERLKELGITHIVFVHGEACSPQTLREKLASSELGK